MKRSKQVAYISILGSALAACTASVSGPGDDSGGAGKGSQPGAGNTSAPGAGSTSLPGAGNSPTPGAGNGPSAAGGGGGTDSSAGGTTLTVGGASAGAAPVEPVTAASALRKVKNLLVGLPPDATELDKVTMSGAAGLQELIGTWIGGGTTQAMFRDKMIAFFRNAFQQTGFIPTEDFKHQLLENGGFDFGPFGTGAVGDDVYFRLIQNIQDSFALTAWATVAENRPFTDVITTQRFQMTTALKSVYLQIEMPNDQPYAFGATNKVAWHVNMGATDTDAIPLETAITNLTFDDQKPVSGGAGFTISPTCHNDGSVRDYTGYAQMFQRLIGYTPRNPFAAQPDCWEHASKPYFTVADTSDWGWVTVKAKDPAAAYQQPYDIPSLRTATELALSLPRVGFFTTPAFLALWNTNDSNQHRVTANQTLLVALGTSFTSDNIIVPVTSVGLDATHATSGPDCQACHKSLDPLRQFWANVYDYNDRNDFPSKGTFMGGVANPRPAKGTTGGALAFLNVNVDKTSGGSMTDLANLLLQVTDNTDGQGEITLFALGMTQKLCFYANSAACLSSDPEFRRIARAFQASSYSFPTLIQQLFSSPLVTGASSTATFEANGMNVSITRRAQMCDALSNRLGRPDICAQAVPVASTTQKATANIAGNIPADAFGRGSENPITPSEPTLFFRAASEMLCENIAGMVVDASSPPANSTNYVSTDPTTAIKDMVERIMGYAPTDAHHDEAVQILTDHFNAAKQSGASASNSLKSTFAAACQSPSAVGIGL